MAHKEVETFNVSIHSTLAEAHHTAKSDNRARKYSPPTRQAKSLGLVDCLYKYSQLLILLVSTMLGMWLPRFSLLDMESISPPLNKGWSCDGLRTKDSDMSGGSLFLNIDLQDLSHFYSFSWTPVTSWEEIIHPTEATLDKTATDNSSVCYKCIKMNLGKISQVWPWPEDDSGRLTTSQVIKKAAALWCYVFNHFVHYCGIIMATDNWNTWQFYRYKILQEEGGVE